MKRLNRFLEERLGGSLTWAIYGLCAAILFRLVVLRDPIGGIFLDLVVTVGMIIILIVIPVKILQWRSKKSHK